MIIRFYLLLFPLMAISCSGELSRSAAKAQIIETMEYPQDELLRLIMEDRTIYRFQTRNEWEKYREAGLLNYGNFGQSSSGGSFPTVTIGGSGVKAELTPKGKTYLKSEIKTAGYEKYVMVKMAELHFHEITGIRTDAEDKNAYVEYTVKRTGLTPFGEIGGLQEELIPKNARFIKYDDGWRLHKPNN